MFHTFQRFSLEKQLFASFVGFAAVLLLLTMGVSLILDINRQMQSTDSLIRSSASYIASLDSVKNMLKQGYPDPEVTKELDSFNESLEDLHVIVICDANSLRFYHTNRQDVGDSFVNGDQEAILQGSEPYITTGYGTYGTQRRAFHAVEDADGTILGFVMTSTFTAEISAHIHRLVLYCLVLFGAALAVALGLSRGLVALLRRSLLGYHPTELLELYLQQGEVLNAVEDGLVATDPKGKVVFANQTACRLFQKSEKALKGRKLNQVFPESSCVQAARTGEAVHNRSCVISGHPVLSSEIPIPGKFFPYLLVPFLIPKAKPSCPIPGERTHGFPRGSKHYVIILHQNIISRHAIKNISPHNGHEICSREMIINNLFRIIQPETSFEIRDRLFRGSGILFQHLMN